MSNSLLNQPSLGHVRQYIEDHNRIYTVYWNYYLGFQYNVEWVKRYYRLYVGIREFYSLIARAVDIDVALTPGGWIVTPETAQGPVNQVLSDSKWRVNGGLMIHNGAVCGDFYIKCIETEEGRSIQPLDTRGVFLDTDIAIIVRNVLDKTKNEVYEHGELIDADGVEIYYDGKLVDEYEHGFGVIPVLYGQNKNVGQERGLNAFYHVMDEVNAVNEMATLMQEAGIRAMNPQKVITGANADQFKLGPDKTVFLPQGSKFEAVDMKLDVADMLVFLQDVYDKASSNLPEMIFDALGNAGKSSALFSPNRDSLEFVAQELMMKIRRMRLGYDATLAQAVNLCNPTIGEWEFDPDRPVLDLQDEPEEETPELTTPTVAETQEM